MSFRRSRVVPALVALLTLLAALPSAAAAPDDPQIEDGAGDAQALDSLWPAELEEARQQTQANLDAYDITKAYIGSETRDQFSIVIELKDMQRVLESPEAVADEDGSYLHADYDAHFQIGGVQYLARSMVDAKKDGDDYRLHSNYSLHEVSDDGAEYLAALGGSVDPGSNLTTLFLHKSQVGDPADGAKLTRFYVTSGHRGIVVDQAPDSKTGLPSAIREPTFGDEYAFGQYARDPRAFTLKPQGATTAEVATDDTATFVAEIENQATSDEEVRLTYSGLSGGWSVRLDTTVVQLSPGSNRLVQIEVTPGQGAGGTGVLILKATSTQGDLSRQTSFTLRHLRDDVPGGDGGDDGESPGGDGTPNAGPEQTLSDGKKANKDSPTVGTALVVTVAVVALAVLRGRRRA